MKKINLGIIGMGRMGITHYSIINSHPNVNIEAVADTSKIVLSLLDKYIEDLNVYRDYKDLIKKTNAEALLVCTPPFLHFPIIKAAHERGINVFVEKPFTTTVKEANELTELFSDNSLINQVGYVNRYNDCFMKAKQLINDNVIGKIIRFKSEMFSPTITEGDEGSGWRASRVNGGGVVFEMASHAIDLVNYLIGKPKKVIGTSMNQIFSKNVQDAVSSTFLFNADKSGTIYVNWSDESHRKPTNKIEVFGDKGKIQVDQQSIKIYLKEPSENEGLREGWNTLYITDVFKNVPFYVRGNEFTRQLHSFVDNILQEKQEKILCSFQDGLDTLEIIEQVFTDHEKNGRIE